MCSETDHQHDLDSGRKDSSLCGVRYPALQYPLQWVSIVFLALIYGHRLYFNTGYSTVHYGHFWILHRHFGLFSVGLLTELISEVQRKRFKDNPANKGKNYTGGLFSLARHINYGGYTLWRTGLALTSGNYWLAALQSIWLTYDFTYRAVPALTQHCSEKYGEGWKKFERDVPYILFPFLW